MEKWTTRRSQKWTLPVVRSRPSVGRMGIVRVSASVSLDGFSAGPDTSEAAPMGVGGERLHRWLFPAGGDRDVPADGTTPPAADAAVAAEAFARTGAVVVGRRTYDIGVELWRDTPFPVPTFVVTHRAHEPAADDERRLHVRHGRRRAAPWRRPGGRGRPGRARHGWCRDRAAGLGAGSSTRSRSTWCRSCCTAASACWTSTGTRRRPSWSRTGLVATDEATHLTFRVVR